MAPELEQAIAAAQAAVQQQGDTVRSLKASLKDGNAQQSQVEEAIQKLQQLKLELSGEQQQQADSKQREAGADSSTNHKQQ
jgi:glycyl-tRNA synthetase